MLATPPRQPQWKSFKWKKNGKLSSFFLQENKILHDLWSLMICREIIKLLIQSRICITFPMHDSKYICFSQRVLYILNDWSLSNIYSNFICIYSRFAFPVYTTYIDWKMTRINRYLTNRYWLVHERLEILLMSCNFTRINVNNIFTVTIDIDTICLILQYTLFGISQMLYNYFSRKTISVFIYLSIRRCVGLISD